MQIPSRWLVALFCTAVLGLAAAAAARALPYHGAQDRDVLSGEITRQFESHYDRVFPVRTLGTNVWAALQFGLFGEGRPGVVVGDSGWLYTEEEFVTEVGAAAALDRHLASIRQVRQQLAAAGTELLVVLIPAKARLYPEYRGEHQPSSIHRDLYVDARQALLDQQVQVPDLLQALRRCKQQAPVFLRTDTHWTPAGARCAAEAVATAEPYPRGVRQYRTALTGSVDHPGDLLQFLPLSPYFDHLLPPVDRLARASTVEAQAEAEADLFSEASAPPLTLIGTSYSADERWNFAGALRQAGQEDVLNLAASGQGPFAPMRDYLRTLPATPPRLVVWEIPERYLPMRVRAGGTTELAGLSPKP